MWFKMQYNRKQALIEASLNGAPMKPHHKRDMLAEGMLVGTADLKIYTHGKTIHVELKRPDEYVLNRKTGNMNKKAGGVQSSEQKEFQLSVESFGHSYYICDNIKDFISICKKHIDT